MQMSKEHHRIIGGLHFTLSATKSFVVKFPSFRSWIVVIDMKTTRIIWGIMVTVLMLGTHLDTVGLAMDVGASSSEMYLLGQDFYLGRRTDGTPDNLTEAFQWFTKAAEAGDPDSQFRLGWFYIDKQKKYDEGRLWLQRAADQQHPMGLLCLGLCHEKGYGIASDPQKAEQFFEKAIPMLQNSAEQGDVEAMCQLAWCYALGDGVSADETKAFQWWQKAADLGDAEAWYNIGACLAFEETQQDREKSFRYFQRASELGVPEADVILGNYYLRGTGVQQDCEKAVQYFQKAADHENDGGMLGLAYCQLHGLGGMTQDTVKAIEWIRKVAKKGNDEAQFLLGVVYADGDGVTQDLGEAIQWFQKSAAQGNHDAQGALKAVREYLKDEERLEEIRKIPLPLPE